MNEARSNSNVTREAVLWAEAEVARQVAEAKRDGLTLEPLEVIFHRALVEYTEAHQSSTPRPGPNESAAVKRRYWNR
jgi:hypothetical protein